MIGMLGMICMMCILPDQKGFDGTQVLPRRTYYLRSYTLNRIARKSNIFRIMLKHRDEPEASQGLEIIYGSQNAGSHDV